MISTAALGPIPPARSVLVTTAAWLIILAGALASLISIISFLMLLARSYGTSTGGLLDWLLVLAGPPVTFVAGIGLLRRRRWAWFCIAGILCAVLAWQAFQIAFPSPSGTTTYTSPSGVPTTVLSSGPAYSLPVIAVCVVMLAVLFSHRSRAEFVSGRMKLRAPAALARGQHAEPAKDWRVGHTGRDSMYYEELRDGVWQRIAIDGEMLIGRAHHVIYFASPEQWQRYPDWARHRRDAIIARIKSVFREPDYEYDGGGTIGATVSLTAVPRATARPMKASEFRALLVALAFLLGITGLMAWLVSNGMQNNETWWPAKRASQQRTVSRAKEPAMFWTSIGIYSGTGLATFGLAVCMVRWSRAGKGA
jgi:hypothetical protein